MDRNNIYNETYKKAFIIQIFVWGFALILMQKMKFINYSKML